MAQLRELVQKQTAHGHSCMPQAARNSAHSAGFSLETPRQKVVLVKGWERFTDAVIFKVNEKDNSVIFAPWGGAAQRKAELITPARHPIVRAAHPSPLSARNGFFGSKSFSAVNSAL